MAERDEFRTLMEEYSTFLEESVEREKKICRIGFL